MGWPKCQFFRRGYRYDRFDGMHNKINPFLIECVEHYPQASSLQHLAADLQSLRCRSPARLCSFCEYEGEKEQRVSASRWILHHDELPLIEPAALRMKKKSALLSLRKDCSSPACGESSISEADCGELLSCWINNCVKVPNCSVHVHWICALTFSLGCHKI